MSNFAELLKQLRKGAGLTQEDLAKKTGLTKFGVMKLEQGARQPSWATVQALAAGLGVPCTAFQEDEPSQEDQKSAKRAPKKKRGSE